MLSWVDNKIRRRLAPFDLMEHVATVSESIQIGARQYLIRPYNALDMVEILELARRAYGEEVAFLTKGILDEGFLVTMKRSASLVQAAFTVLVDGEICGFVRYSTWTNILLQQKNFENLIIYVAPEHRSFVLFRRLGQLFERAGREVGADQILFSFESGKSPESKRKASEKIGFECVGAFLGKTLDPTMDTSTPLLGRRRPSLRSLRVVKKYSRLGRFDFFIYVVGILLYIRSELRRGTVFVELFDGPESLVLARTIRRRYDLRKIALVTIMQRPTIVLITDLINWALRNGCAEILINTKELGVNPCSIFEDYQSHGFTVKGYILRKSAANGTCIQG